MARHHKQEQDKVNRNAKRHLERMKNGGRQTINMLQRVLHSQAGVHDHGNVPLRSVHVTFLTYRDEGRHEQTRSRINGKDEFGFVKESVFRILMHCFEVIYNLGRKVFEFVLHPDKAPGVLIILARLQWAAYVGYEEV